ncbi:MAG: hypothetical protein WAM28_02120 [Chlamydiales bacterium]
MISIAQKPFVFSHLPGSTCLIPGTSFQVVAFPTRIEIYELCPNKKRLVKQIQLDIKGPVQKFIMKQDLQRGCVSIWSEKLCCHILPNLDVVFRKKAPHWFSHVKEQLSLGSHKKQEWEAIRKRGDFREIFPIWFRLGTLLNLPEREYNDEDGMFSLLQQCLRAAESNRPETILSPFKKLFLAAFEGMLVPRLKDEQFQGILPDNAPISPSSPLYLLKEGAKLIRSLFIQSSKNEIAILPHLPPQFFAGRMLHLSCPPFGEIDLEWSKKQIHRLVFRAHQDGELSFRFHSSLSSFRLRTERRDKGKILACDKPLEIKSGCDYLLDQFQK